MRLTWANGSTTTANLDRLLDTACFRLSGILSSFSKVGIRCNEGLPTWPGELEFCLGALWFDAHPQDNPLAG